LTVAQLGELTGLDEDVVSEIESGRPRVDVDEPPRFASALGVTLKRLFGASELSWLATLKN
jgi:transcriptional regulator with XRE-family HTH domain